VLYWSEYGRQENVESTLLRLMNPREVGVVLLLAYPRLTRRVARCVYDALCQVRVYTVEDVSCGGRPGLHYQRALATAGTKALCVTWTAKAECVVSGAADGTAHVWEATTGRHLLRITAGGGGLRTPGTELCVWAMLVRCLLCSR
jgi:hypothetical protein